MCTSNRVDISAKVSVLVEFVSHLVAFGCILCFEHREDLCSDFLIQRRVLYVVLLLHLTLDDGPVYRYSMLMEDNAEQCKNARMRRFCIGKMHEARSAMQGAPSLGRHSTRIPARLGR